MLTHTHLACMDCGHGADLLKERKFLCPKCGGLYDVHSDYSDFPYVGQPGTYLQKIRRHFSTPGQVAGENAEYQSDVWAFIDLVMPYMQNTNIVTLGERIQIVPAGKKLREWLGLTDVFLALEGLSPSGSFKDFGGTALATVAKAGGIKRVVCASTGDTSAMLAAYAAAGGMQCVVLLPKGLVTFVQAIQPIAFGATVLFLPTDFDGCMRVMQELVDKFGAYPGNSINPARIEGHQATTFKAWWYFDGELPEWIVAPVGNGSNSSSIGKGQRLLQQLSLVNRLSRILGVQPENSAPLTSSWRRIQGQGTDDLAEQWKAGYLKVKAGSTLATAAQIGAPVSYKKVIREVCASDGAMDTANDAEILEALRVCGSDGHFVCPQTGMALAGLRKQAKAGRVEWDSRVLVVSTAAGIKFPNVLDSIAPSLTHDLRHASAEAVAEYLQ